MANYKKQTFVGGKWVKAAEIKPGTKAKIVSETTPQSSTFLDKNGMPKTQDVCKVQFQGQTEALNVNLNRPTLNALVDAFGEDSAAWMNRVLTTDTEKVKVGGKTVHALYLIPEGYEKVDDANGYTVIVKEGTGTEDEPEDLPEIPF
jgi:hypothetical protein